nr:hypothetical protein [Tanacetum cinerariifolium]
MADLKFVDQHNMVAYLAKSDDNIEFHQIVDFLSSCSINYALTVSPTIYASHIEHFWNTASSKTISSLKQIHAIVDGKAVVISDSSVRSDLLFDDEDDEAIHTEEVTVWKGLSLLMLAYLRRQETMWDTPAQTRSERVLEQSNKPPLSEAHTSGSGDGRMEHTFELTDTVSPTPYDLPLTRGYTPESDEGRLKLLELMNTCTTLSNMGTTLENELSSTKAVYHKAFITLTKRVKKLETQLKQKKSREIIHSSDEEEPSLGEVQKIAEPLKDDDDATLAKTLLNIKRSTTKDKGKEEEVEAQADTDQEIKEMKLFVKIVTDEDIAIDAIPLATKPSVIVEYKIVKEGKISTYHIIKADESTKRYTLMIKLLENIDREDLETLWKLVKDKHGNTRPEEDYERVLWGDIKVMFEPNIESEVWRQLQGYDVTAWKLFSSSGVHFMRFKNLHIFMLVDKIYPLTPVTITKMLERKLQADLWNEMCYQHLKLMLKQQRKR